MDFDTWFSRVDRAVMNTVGMGAEDLPDVDYWSMWEAGYSPGAAAKDTIAQAMDEMGMTADW